MKLSHSVDEKKSKEKICVFLTWNKVIPKHIKEYFRGISGYTNQNNSPQRPSQISQWKTVKT